MSEIIEKVAKAICGDYGDWREFTKEAQDAVTVVSVYLMENDFRGAASWLDAGAAQLREALEEIAALPPERQDEALIIASRAIKRLAHEGGKEAWAKRGVTKDPRL